MTRFTGSEGGSIREGSERAQPLDEFVARLIELGATDDEIEQVRTAWADAPADARDESRFLGDGELLRGLREAREIEGGSDSTGAIDDDPPSPDEQRQ